MAAKIQEIEDPSGNIIYPPTLTSAVFDEDDNRLDNILAGINDSLSGISDSLENVGNCKLLAKISTTSFSNATVEDINNFRYIYAELFGYGQVLCSTNVPVALAKQFSRVTTANGGYQFENKTAGFTGSFAFTSNTNVSAKTSNASYPISIWGIY